MRSLTLAGPAGRLEALLNEGAPDAPLRRARLPSSSRLVGGTMHNKVVYHAMKALNDPAWGLGWPVLRFNFRGAGLSQGTHDGEAETGDVLAALDWLEREFQRAPRRRRIQLWRGHGAAGLLRPSQSRTPGHRRRPRAHRPRPAHHGIEAPLIAYSFLQNLTIPKLFLSGDRDQFAPAAQLTQVAASAAEPNGCCSFPAPITFLQVNWRPMQQALAGWLKEQLP